MGQYALTIHTQTAWNELPKEEKTGFICHVIGTNPSGGCSAPPDEWQKYTSAGGSSGDETVSSWGNIRPVSITRPDPSAGAFSYRQKNYNQFFEYFLIGDINWQSPDWFSKKKPSLDYVKKFAKSSGLSIEEAEQKWNTLNDLSTPESSEHPFGNTGAEEWMARLYELFGFLTGIPYDILPVDDYRSRRSSMPSQIYDAYFRSWHKGGITDFADVLLYLYFAGSNARRDAKQRLQDLIDDAKLDRFEDATLSQIETAGGALELRAAQKVTKKIKEGQKLTSKDKELLRTLAAGNRDFFHAKVRDAEQCLLRLNIENFASAYYNKPSAATANDRALGARRHRPHKSIYQDSMSPATIMNKLAYSPHSGPFLEARTHEVSQLTPMIRLFKTYYNETTNDIDEEVEFYFDGGTTPDSALESRTGVGIKSFEWNLNATNPATVKNDITATLTLYFQGFGELSTEHTYRETQTAAPKKFQYQDLLIRPDRYGKRAKDITSVPPPGVELCNDRDNSIYDSRFYEVKALVGWAPPVTLEASSKNMVSAVNNQQIPLFLTLIDHEFSFTQEGTYELKITYRARMEALNSDPRLDVLTTSTVKQAVNGLQEDIRAARKNCDSKEAIEELEDAIAVERELDRDRLAGSILEGLSPRIYITNVKTEKIHQALLGTDEADYYKSMEIVRGVSIAKSEIQRSIKNTDESLREEIKNQLQVNLVDSSGQGTRKQKDEADKAVKGGKKVKDLGAFEGISDPKLTRIPWFYFGDLVDVVVNHAIENNAPGSKEAPALVPGVELENLVYLMGTYDYTRVGAWSYTTTPGGIKILTPSNLSRAIGQISAVPVTVASYNSWFVKNVVNAERSSFPLMEFLRSFIQQVIVPILNRKCFDTDNFKRFFTDQSNVLANPWIEIAPLIPKTASISLPPAFTIINRGAPDQKTIRVNPLELFRTTADVRTSAGPLIHASEINLKNFHPPRTADDPNTLIPTRRDNSRSQTIKDSFHISVFYLVGQDSYKDLGPSKGEDREDRDFKKGIYHLYLGADVGLVKEVTFSKVDAPYLREARIQQDSLNPLAQLAATYNVSLKMVGNTIFWPGQYIFVNPVGYGTGKPWDRSSISNQLGLGGYHLVTEVKSFVEDGKYETTVKGLFEFSGDGCPSLPQSTPSDPCNPDPTNHTGPGGPEDNRTALDTAGEWMRWIYYGF